MPGTGYNIVFIMNTAKPQVQGNITVASPGGRNMINYAQTDGVGISGISGPTHGTLPTGVQNLGTGFLPASGANAKWGTASGHVCAYPTYYFGSNLAYPVAAISIG